MQTDFITKADAIQKANSRHGFKDLSILIWKTGIPRTTFYRRLSDGNWDLNQIEQLDNFLDFTDTELRILAGRKISQAEYDKALEAAGLGKKGEPA